MQTIKKLRKDAGMKQSELAKILNVGQSTVSGWENDAFEPDRKTLCKIAEIFNISVEYLIRDSDTKKAPSYEDAGLSAEEAALLNAFRQAPAALQDAALRVLQAEQAKE